MAIPLGKPSDKADRPVKAPRTRSRAAWCGKERKLPQETPEKGALMLPLPHLRNL